MPNDVKLFWDIPHQVDVDSIYYSINGGPERVYTEPFRIKDPGVVTYNVRAVDNLGNSSESTTHEIFIK